MVLMLPSNPHPVHRRTDKIRTQKRGRSRPSLFLLGKRTLLLWACFQRCKPWHFSLDLQLPARRHSYLIQKENSVNDFQWIQDRARGERSHSRLVFNPRRPLSKWNVFGRIMETMLTNFGNAFQTSQTTSFRSDNVKRVASERNLMTVKLSAIHVLRRSQWHVLLIYQIYTGAPFSQLAA